MKGKKAQLEFAIIKGLAIALAIVGSLLIYETITAKTSDGTQINCNWDCRTAEWSNCVNGYSYRDSSKCIPNSEQCWNSEPKPPNTTKCD